MSGSNCVLRLNQKSVQSSPGPTTMKGGAVALDNAIRRRVGRVTRHSAKNGATESYGPLFGLNKGKLGSACVNKNIKTANGGSGSDVTYWKRVYGRSLNLFSSSGCNYGCSSANNGGGAVASST